MLISLKNISLNINNKEIIKDVSLDIKQGEITTLIGPNGGGKTSIARIILGILKASNGQIIKNENLNIGYMPQKITFDKTIPLRVIDFLELSNKSVNLDNNLLTRLGVKNYLYEQIQDLSGGLLQKVLLINALSNNPDLLVLDEPTQYLDINATQDFYKIIDELRQKRKCAILLISHDLLTIMQKTDQVYCVNGHICCSGTPAKVNEDPQYISLFPKSSNLGIYQHHHDHKH